MNKELEVWGGIECTVHRIGDTFQNQCARSGHDDRPGDLDLIADLGIKTLRYPVLWEVVAPEGLQKANWEQADERLYKLKELGIEPIVGLVHHGSGPMGTSLVDDSFVSGLASFAAAVAKRYPWVKYYTPVNEPLTTARFSALYGHWYPHRRDDASFLRATIVQCKAILWAMDAVKRSNPQAQLVQTEDLGKTYSTPTLTYQAEFENERRWLTLDLLTGHKPGARIKKYLESYGVSQDTLNWFSASHIRPDILGINHYITSERYLDENLHLYPSCYHGGNDQHRYADVEAVRVDVEIGNIHKLLREVWNRYHLPMSITEAHIGDTVIQQQRWLWERWQAALDCRAEGIDVRAVTVWALLGSYDWNSLLTRCANFYEPGAFDVSSGQPIKTQLADMIKALSSAGHFDAPHLDSPGWWSLPERVLYPSGKVIPMEDSSGDSMKTA